MSLLNFNTIIGPPCEGALNEASSNGALKRKEAEVTLKINDELAKLGPAPRASDYFPPPSTIPPLVGRTFSKECPVVVSLYTRSYPTVPLNKYYADTNNYLLKRTAIFCNNPTPFISVSHIRQFEYRIYYKETTNKSYKYYINESTQNGKNTLISDPEGFLFGENRGNGRYFNCSFGKNEDFFERDSIEEEVKFYYFQVEATTIYKIYSNKTWIIDVPASNIKITSSLLSFLGLKQNNSINKSLKDYSIKSNVFNLESIPNNILELRNDWRNEIFNNFGNANEVFISRESDIEGDKTFNCEDDCGRPIDVTIFKEKTTRRTSSLVRCLNEPCSNNEKGKVVDRTRTEETKECKIIQ